MNKLYLIIAIVIALWSAAYSTEIDQSGVLGKSEKVDDSELKMLLIPSMKHEVRIIVTEDGGRVLMSDEFSVLRDEIKTCEDRAFFLNKDFVIESLLINGVANELYLLDNIRAEHIQPRLRLLSLIDVSQFSNVYSITMPDVSAFPDTVHFMLKYVIPTSDTLKYTDVQNGSVTARGQNFWYARNIHLDEEVKLSVSAPRNYLLEIGDQRVAFKNVSSRKAFEYSFRDSDKAPNNLKIIKQLN
ncbi:MAG: hypothetical protein CVU48_06060 [Candidatus Cloacimonetes bacterium HGW-Cloacimonetes-1]|jgi:hypothetical protein|nr:MAG: hypothetical protein CVU48_06060 [Candidatus Cloacimonetes bacterium HGW-Cloacimonetes-1]